MDESKVEQAAAGFGAKKQQRPLHKCISGAGKRNAEFTFRENENTKLDSPLRFFSGNRKKSSHNLPSFSKQMHNSPHSWHI
jgi:hypothetical protein